MNQRLLSNMECQNKMSTTLLDLRGHFEKMSAFMEGIATKMEIDRTTATYASRQAPTDVGVLQRGVRGISHNSQSLASSDSTYSGSSASKTSVQSDASSTMYCSPEKKKQRSHRKVGTHKRTDMTDNNIFSEEFEAGPGLDTWRYVTIWKLRLVHKKMYLRTTRRGNRALSRISKDKKARLVILAHRNLSLP